MICPAPAPSHRDAQISACQDQHRTPRLPRLHRPLAAFAAALGILGGLATGVSALEPTVVVGSQPLNTAAPLADGNYLYGEAPTAGELGATYLVMTVDAGQAVGAFYMTNSSFDCFHGQVAGDELAVTIINSYDQTAYDYAVAFATSTLASQAGGGTVPTLEGFYALDTLSELDHQILATCQGVVASAN